MSGCLYFSNNLKNMKDHIKLQNLFQLMVTVFKENLRATTPFLFYSSVRFVFETVFISESIAGNWLGSLLEISGKFITKLNVCSYLILQFMLKTVWKIS